MTRTLVVSDFHLGGRLDRDVLRRPQSLEALLAALDGVDRLVLLGDVIELLEQEHRKARQAAEPVLRRLGSGLGRGREVVLVPGNHDTDLIRPWLRARGVPAAVEAPIPLDATAMLADVASWLAPARVLVRYPGIWLSEAVWATHGHYLDRHLLPDSAYGVGRGLLGRLPADAARPEDYERAGGPWPRAVEGLLARRLPRPVAALFDDLAEVMRAATMPASPKRLLPRRMAPLTARLLGTQMRRASVPALARVAHRLGVEAEWVVFGHVHRCGPLAGDDLQEWRGPGGRPRIVNTGSWVYEPLLVHRASPPHPYWPGGAVLLEEGGEPRPLGLLDHLDAGSLH